MTCFKGWGLCATLSFTSSLFFVGGFLFISCFHTAVDFFTLCVYSGHWDVLNYGR